MPVALSCRKRRFRSTQVVGEALIKAVLGFLYEAFLKIPEQHRVDCNVVLETLPAPHCSDLSDAYEAFLKIPENTMRFLETLRALDCSDLSDEGDHFIVVGTVVRATVVKALATPCLTKAELGWLLQDTSTFTTTALSHSRRCGCDIGNNKKDYDDQPAIASVHAAVHTESGENGNRVSGGHCNSTGMPDCY